MHISITDLSEGRKKKLKEEEKEESGAPIGLFPFGRWS